MDYSSVCEACEEIANRKEVADEHGREDDWDDGEDDYGKEICLNSAGRMVRHRHDWREGFLQSTRRLTIADAKRGSCENAHILQLDSPYRILWSGELCLQTTPGASRSCAVTPRKEGAMLQQER